jgi:hypothetical protein
VESKTQQEPSEAIIEASPTFVLRGNVESDGSQVSNVVWDTPESLTTPSDFLHDWDGSSSEASATNIPEGYRYQLVGNDGGRVRYSDYYYSATRTLRDHYVQAAIRNDAREADAVQATTGLIVCEDPMPGRIRPRPADGGMFFGPPGPTPPTSDTGEPWDSDEQWGSVRDTPSPDGCETDDEDESSVNEEPVSLVPAVRPRSPVRGAAPRVGEPDEDFVPPRGPSPGSRPEIPQHRCVRPRSQPQPYRTWRLGDGGPFRACSRAMFYSQPRTAAERAQSPTEYANTRGTERDPTPPPEEAPPQPPEDEEEAPEDEDPEIARGDPVIPEFHIPGSPISIVGCFSDTESEGDDLPPLVAGDDPDSDESNIGDEVTFDDHPENHASEYARAYQGAVNWLNGAPGAQHGTGYSDAFPSLHEEHAAALPRYFAVASRPDRVHPVAHYEDLRDRFESYPGSYSYVAFDLSRAFQQTPLDPTYVSTYVRERGSPDMAAVITEDYRREVLTLDPSLRTTGEIGGDPSKSSTAWYGILDSGATCSILTGDAIDLFDGGSLHALTSMTVNTASRGGSLRINAMGSIGRFPEMYYADDLRHSIVAVADLLAQGYQVEFKTGGAIITHEDGHFIECVHMDGKAV